MERPELVVVVHDGKTDVWFDGKNISRYLDHFSFSVDTNVLNRSDLLDHEKDVFHPELKMEVDPAALKRSLETPSEHDDFHDFYRKMCSEGKWD